VQAQSQHLPGLAGRADLSGTLGDWRPLTLLAFLADTAKTGVLTVTGTHHEVQVWMQGGTAVAADASGATDLLDGLVEALRTPAGTFTFRLEVVDAPAELPEEMGLLLHRAAERLRSWEQLAQTVPSLQLLISLLPVEGEAQLSADAWAVSVAVAGGYNTPAAVAAHLEWGPFRTCTAVADLVAAGRAKLSPPTRRKRFGELETEGANSAIVTGPADWHAAKRPLWPGAGGSLDDRWSPDWVDEA
jgi:hypothetical protein